VRGVLRSAVYPIQWTGTMKICCGIAMNRMGMLKVIGKKMKALTVKMETVTLIGEGRKNSTLSV
jgi:hypothetical protein